MYPDDVKYTSEHEWVRTGGEDDAVRVGVTHYAQEALGDIVYVSLPEEGETLEAGQVIGEVESTKSVSEIYAPLSGSVVGRNTTLDDQPDLVNSDPYGAGWMFDMTLDESPTSATAELMDSATYQEMVHQQ